MPKRGRRKQILIVDNEPGAALRLRGVVEGLGYRGVTARFDDAMGLARGLKLSMALLDGAADQAVVDAVASQLRRAAIPVVVLYPETDAPPTINGATGYLRKPWRTADLVQLLYRFAGAAE